MSQINHNDKAYTAGKISNNNYSREFLNEINRKTDSAVMKNIDSINLYICIQLSVMILPGFQKYRVKYSNSKSQNNHDALVFEGVIDQDEYEYIKYIDLMKMYTGNSEPEPTFSGAFDLHYPVYSDEVRKWTDEALNQIRKQTVMEELKSLSVNNDAESNLEDEFCHIDHLLGKNDNNSLSYVESMLPVYKENYTVSHILDIGKEEASRILKNRSDFAAYRKDVETALTVRAGKRDLNIIPPELHRKGYCVTEDDKELLKQLNEIYSAVDLELFSISGKLHFSSSLESSYNSLRDEVLEKEKEFMRNHPLWIEYSDLLTASTNDVVKND